MSNTPHDLTSRSIETSSRKNKRILFYISALGIAFLLGLVPMWWRARSCANELNSVQGALRISSLQNMLANASMDARRGDYEPARQATSEFFTKLRTEVDRGRDSVFTEAQRNNLTPVFATRDDTITLLARSDPASSDRLTDLYNKYRQVAVAPVR
jgi:hypothetical protein